VEEGKRRSVFFYRREHEKQSKRRKPLRCSASPVLCGKKRIDYPRIPHIELTERSEVPVVNKQASVVAEVKLSKDVTERNETVRHTVRRTEVDIDELKDRDTNTRR
jgi:stress response protein YsnF